VSRAALLLCIVLATSILTAQDESGDIKVNVKLVNVFATVTDENGAPITGLNKNDFTILEDGAPQKIAVFEQDSGLPLSIVLAIDASGSVAKDLKLELDSARHFVSSILRPVDQVSLYQFTQTVQELTPFTSSIKRIDSGIKHVHAGAATAMYDAIYLGGRALVDRQGRKVIVIITDGGDTASQVKFQEAVRAAQQAEAIVYSIIIVPIEASPGRNTGGEHALIQLSRDTGGKYYYAKSPEDLGDAFSQISTELRTQYLLAYYPTQRRADSDFRRIEIQADGGKYKVRHRAGYYTSSLE